MSALDKHPQALFFLYALAVLAGVLLQCSRTLSELFLAWQTDEFSHGILVPVISLIWAIGVVRDKPLSPAPSWWGLGIFVSGLAFHVMGIIAANNWISEIAVVVIIGGLAGSALGLTGLRALAAPLFFLVLAIPMPVTMYPALTAGMQLLASDLGVSGIQLLGLPVFQEGNIIDLGGQRLHVAEACSGLRYLFPLMALGYLAAFALFRSPWKRVVLFASTIPIAVLMNAFRITFVAVTVERWGTAMAEGTLHDAEGFAVFFGCLACVWGVAQVLARCGSRERVALPEFNFTWRAPHWMRGYRPSRGIMLATVLMLISSNIIAVGLERREQTEPPARLPFAAFPLEIGEWRGTRSLLSSEELKALHLTDYLLADFSRPGESNRINFYIAYYASQRQGASIHSPAVCIPGAGWKVTSSEKKIIDLRSAGLGTIEVNQAIIEKGEVRQLLIYWFQEHGVNTASTLEAKWLMLKDFMRSGRTDGALIRVTALLQPGHGVNEEEARIRNFLSDVFSLANRYLPGNI